MERKEFLKNLGITGAAAFAVMTLGCLESCSSKTGTFKPSGTVDFTLDLTDSANAAILVNGGYVIKDQVVIAKNNSGAYIAATIKCSHEGNNNVVYRSSTDNYYCNVHGAEFDQTGKGLNSNGKGGLTIYNTQLSGTSLRVFS